MCFRIMKDVRFRIRTLKESLYLLPRETLYNEDSFMKSLTYVSAVENNLRQWLLIWYILWLQYGNNVSNLKMALSSTFLVSLSAPNTLFICFIVSVSALFIKISVALAISICLVSSSAKKSKDCSNPCSDGFYFWIRNTPNTDSSSENWLVSFP